MVNTNFTPFPTLTTDHLILRRLTMDDAEAIAILRSNKKVNEFIDRKSNTNNEEAKQFIDKIEKAVANNESVYWAISLKTINPLIGTICLWNISHKNNSAEIGYELHPDFQGKGFMQEAIAAVIQWGFEKMNLTTIIGLVKPQNKKSIRVLINNHFRIDSKYEFVNEKNTEGYDVYYLQKLQNKTNFF